MTVEIEKSYLMEFQRVRKATRKRLKEESIKIANQGDKATYDQLRFKKILDNIDNLEPSF